MLRKNRIISLSDVTDTTLNLETFVDSCFDAFARMITNEGERVTTPEYICVDAEGFFLFEDIPPIEDNSFSPNGLFHGIANWTSDYKSIKITNIDNGILVEKVLTNLSDVMDNTYKPYAIRLDFDGKTRKQSEHNGELLSSKIMESVSSISNEIEKLQKENQVLEQKFEINRQEIQRLIEIKTRLL